MSNIQITRGISAEQRLIEELKQEIDDLKKSKQRLKRSLDECRDQRDSALADRTPLTYQDALLIGARRQDEIWEHDMNYLIETFPYALWLELLMKDVDTAAGLYTKDNGEELRQYLTANIVGDLSKWLSMAAALLNNPLNGIRERAQARMNGITALINGEDDGSQLRELAKERGGFAEYVMQWRESLKLAGKEKGKGEWSTSIALKVADFLDEQDRVGITRNVMKAAGDTVNYFKELPISYDKDKRHEQTAKNKIEGWGDKAVDYVRGHYYSWLEAIKAEN